MFDGIAEHEGRKTELANAIFFLRNCLSWVENLILVIYFTPSSVSVRPHGIFRLCTTTKLKMDSSTKSSKQIILFQT